MPTRSRTTAYPRLRSPVIAARVSRCGSHPVDLGQIDDGCAVGSPQQVDHQRQLAAVAWGGCMRLSTDVSRLPLAFLSGSGSACVVSLALIASSDPSSTAMAFSPVAVSLSA